MKNKLIKTLLLVAGFLTFQISLAQESFDKIILVDKTSIDCKVLRVTGNSIEIDPKGSIPFQILERSKIDYIIYSDNTVVNFKSNESKEKIVTEKPLPELTKEEIFKNCSGGVFFTNHMTDVPDLLSNEWEKYNETNDKKFRLCNNVLTFHSQVVFSYRASDRGILNSRQIETSTIMVTVILFDQDDSQIYSKNVTIPNKFVTNRNGAAKSTLPEKIEMVIDNFELFGQKFIIKLFFGNVRWEVNGKGVTSPVALKFSTDGWVDPVTGY